MVKCLMCETEYGFIQRWNSGAGLVKWGASTCSETCRLALLGLSEEQVIERADKALKDN